MATAALPSSFSEEVRVDSQGDIRLGVTQPLADRDDVHTGINQLIGMGVPQAPQAERQ
jgi:hypothetical protein